MRKLLLLFALLACIPVSGYGQAGSYTTLRSGATLPATCSPGGMFFKTTAPIGTHQCSATNTWLYVLGAATSSTVGQVLRVTGTNTFGLGALDLSDADAVTNDLPDANLSANVSLFGASVDSSEITTDTIAPTDVDESQDFSFVTLSGKQDRNNTAVNDDDCTGEQGLWWYDTTDSAFEWCNANSGVPTALVGGGTVTTTGTMTVDALVTSNATTVIKTPSATATLDSSGNLSTPGTITSGVGGSDAGTVELGEGAAPSLTANTFSLYAPADVAAGGLGYVVPAAAASGIMIATNSSGVMTISHSALSGDVATSGAVATIQANSVALTTDTTGNYAAGDAEAGAALTGDSATGFFGAGALEDARVDGTLESDEVAPAEAYSESGWNADTAPPQKDGVRDKLEAMPQTAGDGLTLTGTDVDCDTSSDTVFGCTEHAIASEVNTGTAADRSITPSALAGSMAGRKYVEILVTADYTTNTAIADGNAYWFIPANLNAWRIIGVEGKVVTVGTTNATNFDIAVCRAVATGSPCSGTVVDLLSTNGTIDSNEDGTETAAAALVIDTANDDLATGDALRFDIDAISTTAAKGLVVIVTLGI